MILAEPSLIAVTKPVSETETMSVLFVDQVTPSTLAVSCNVSPTWISFLPPSEVISILTSSASPDEVPGLLAGVELLHAARPIVSNKALAKTGSNAFLVFIIFFLS